MDVMRLKSVNLECSRWSHEDMKRDPGIVASLEFIGWQKSIGERLELRNCPACKSTLCTGVYLESVSDGAQA